MDRNFSYGDYVEDDKFITGYNEYQNKYAEKMRESDRVLVGLAEGICKESKQDEPLSLLDVGCSTGNLLLHLKQHLRDIRLSGAELAESSLEQAKSNPDLAGVDFAKRDLLDLELHQEYDIIVVNAVFYMLNDEQLKKALKSVCLALKPGGSLLAFDFFHPFEQDLSVLEKSTTHPEGLMLHMRPQDSVKAILEDAGFSTAQFMPFSMPIDLEKPSQPDDMRTYTVKDEKGGRLSFRGVLFQPWCHLHAVKA
jgi:SAM-dependent methyltransferase